MDGVLVIDKPEGPTSHDVVAVARRVLREKRIGHTGTLDPRATGVLPLVIGRATRLSTLLTSSDKEYEADVRLGAATATYDAADRLAAGGAPPDAPDIPLADIERVLAGFRGSFDQVPPPFSAKKLAGVPAYKLARKDQAPPLVAVSVTVRALDVLGYTPGLLRIRVVTSPGFYVRSLAHDVGEKLGCGGHLEALRRTRAGAFSVGNAAKLDELIERPGVAAARLVPLNELLPELPAARLTVSGARKASHGNPLTREDLAERGPDPLLAAAAAKGGQAPFVRLLDGADVLVAIATTGPDGLLRPSIVLV